MHSLILLGTLLMTLILRWVFIHKNEKDWHKQWENKMLGLVFPPLLILMTSIALFWMGHHGEMLGMSSTRWGCHVAIAFLAWSLLLLGYQACRAWKTTQNLKQYPLQKLENISYRLIPSSLPYSAQIGWWKSELVLSQGLLDLLDQDHLEAVLAHEKAHKTYQDTFWFFWLGYLRLLTRWLPYSQSLWEELLLLREIRADQIAIKTVDPLILAESLLQLAQFQVNLQQNDSLVAAFNDNSDRLEQRIEAILNPSIVSSSYSWQNNPYLLFVFLPLLTIPWHHPCL